MHLVRLLWYFFFQLELGTSKTSIGYVIEELAAKQPSSIAYLRQYLAPSSVPRNKLTPNQKTPPTQKTPPSNTTTPTSNHTLASVAASRTDKEKPIGPL